MAARSGLERTVLPLLAVLLLAPPAAVVSEDIAVRDARAAINLGDFARAEKIIGDALAAAKNTQAFWELRILRGELLIGRGQPAEGLAELAFDLPPKYRQSETAMQQLLLRAFATGDVKWVDAAKKLATEHQPSMLGDVYFTMSAVKRTEKDAREAIRLSRKYGRHSTEAKALANLGFVLCLQQRFAESIQWSEQAARLGRELRLEKIAEKGDGNAGWAYFELGDYETAEELFTRAEARARRIQVVSEPIPWLIQLGNIRFQQRDWEGAARYYRDAITAATQQQRGYALANMARISMELNRFDDAKRFNAQALEAKRAAKDEEAELTSTLIDARISTALGDDPRAQKLLESVLRTTKHNSTLMECETILARVFARIGRSDLAATHFRSAVEVVNDARKEVKDKDLRFAFFNSTGELFTAYIDFLVTTNRKEDALAVTELSRAQTLEEGLNVRAEPRALDARAVAKKNNATILCYWLGRDRSYLWVVTPAEVKLVPLPPDTAIEKTVTAYGNDLRSPYGWLTARGEELYRTLIAPAGIAKGSRVIVVADGKLHTLNFETLVVPGASRHYWIEDVTVMNAGSLQLLARSASKPKTSVRMLLVGNAPNPAFPQLRYAADEMRRIERRFPNPKVLEGPAATPAAYKAASPGTYDYVHFVAHGVPTRKRPLDSAVILARDASSSYKLLARDVVDQPLNARLVTISSCHGAGTRTYAGEGVVGLAWAFLRAGADQVVASLWEVNDAAAPQLMDAMYEGIRANRDPAVALRDAKLKLLRSGKLFRYPRYWAPFVLYAGT